jgi:hypothetical protein
MLDIPGKVGIFKVNIYMKEEVLYIFLPALISKYLGNSFEYSGDTWSILFHHIPI